MENNHEARIAVLEVKVTHHENKFEEVNTSLDKLNDEMQVLVTAVTGLNATIDRATTAIEKVSALATENNNKWIKFNSYTEGMLKVGSIVIFLLGCAWAVFTHFDK